MAASSPSSLVYVDPANATATLEYAKEQTILLATRKRPVNSFSVSSVLPRPYPYVASRSHHHNRARLVAYVHATGLEHPSIFATILDAENNTHFVL
jgi:hypothetical protein